VNYGTIRITTPDGQVRDHPLETPAARIGRSPENNIVVDHVTVSRRHARVSIDSGQCFIEDLESDSGTFVGGVRLAPGERQLFGMMPARIGDVEVAFFAPEPASSHGGGSATSIAAPPPAAAAQVLAVTLSGPAGAVTPGGQATATVQIQNKGTTVDEVTIAAVDLPAGWATVTRPLITLLPGARDEVVVTLSPPRGVEATAGDHPFGVAVRSNVRGTEVRALGVLTVGSVAGFTVAIQPVRSNREFKLALENTGNAPAALSLAAHDDEGKLRFDFETMNVDLGPGERRVVSLKVKLPGAPRLGPEVIKGFRVEAGAQGDSAKQTASGQLRIKPKLEAWRVPAIALVVLAALAGGGVAYASRCEDLGLPGCQKDDEVTAGAGDGDGRGAVVSATAVTTAAGGETATASSTAPTSTTPPATATTPAAPPTKHVPGTLRFPKAEIVLDPDEDYIAVVTTTAGEFIIDLDIEAAYNTSNSFAFLALKGFYDGMPFVPSEESVEHGDPEGDGTGTAGYTQELERTEVTNKQGTVGMIRVQDDLGAVGSQWYINLEDNIDQFDRARIRGNPRPVFGVVVEGLEVAQRLTEKDTVEHITIFRK
jgi:cyclophilin family peptidyl-prolyl cis-trans isomerase